MKLIIIVVSAVVAIALLILLIYIAIWRSQHRRHADTPHNPNAVIGMEGIMPEIRRNSNGLITFSPEAARAQKFRERAKSVSIGKPEFRVSKKYEGKALFKTLEQHPNFKDFSEDDKAFVELHGRKVSEDQTSHCNSCIDDIEALKHLTTSSSHLEEEKISI